MPTIHTPALEQLRLLAEFRHQLRMFLVFSERAALAVGLQPQQHQLLLQVAGAPAGSTPNISWLADRLGLRQNSVVELSIRCAELGLVERRQDDVDRRQVRLEVTRKGLKLLEKLSADHARELTEQAPLLVDTLHALGLVAHRGASDAE